MVDVLDVFDVDVLEAVGEHNDKDKPKTDEGIQAEESKPEDTSVKAEIVECKKPWDPVTLVLVETLKSKRGSETLLGIQRLYSCLIEGLRVCSRKKSHRRW